MTRRRSSQRRGQAPLPEKLCRVCGRRFSWRKKWEQNWEAIRTCSERCRREGLRPRDRELERSLMTLLAERAVDATACPSEAARSVGGQDEDAWRRLMEPARRAARRLAADDRVRFLQGGAIVDPSSARGPVRIGRGPKFATPPLDSGDKPS